MVLKGECGLLNELAFSITLICLLVELARHVPGLCQLLYQVLQGQMTGFSFQMPDR